MGERITDQALAAAVHAAFEGPDPVKQIALVARQTLAREREYNGWPNYETWAVNLWITNDEAPYHAARGLVRDTPDRAADALKEWVDSHMIPDLGASMASDLLSAALGEVDWQRIAEALAE